MRRRESWLAVHHRCQHAQPETYRRMRIVAFGIFPTITAAVLVGVAAWARLPRWVELPVVLVAAFIAGRRFWRLAGRWRPDRTHRPYITQPFAGGRRERCRCGAERVLAPGWNGVWLLGEEWPETPEWKGGRLWAPVVWEQHDRPPTEDDGTAGLYVQASMVDPWPTDRDYDGTTLRTAVHALDEEELTDSAGHGATLDELLGRIDDTLDDQGQA